MKKTNYKKCEKCGNDIATYVYNKHLKVCTGIWERRNSKFNIQQFKECSDGLFECNVCKKHYTKKGICSHYYRSHTDSGKNHLIGCVSGRDNQFTKAKKMGLPKPSVSAETRNKISIKSRERRHSTKTKEKLSEIQSRLLEEKGNGGFINVKYYEIKNINNTSYIVRGTWELKYAEWLNKNSVLWERKHYLKYHKEDNINRTYCADFYLPNTNEYIEIKGYFSESDKLKIKCVEEQNNIKVKMLFFADLKNLGIL